MKKILITIITVNQRNVETLAGLLMNELRITRWPVISRYHKFRNSYKIELEKITGDKVNQILKVIDIASKIGEPWNIYFDSGNKSIELIFNRTKQTHFLKDEYYCIRWAQIIIS